MDEHNNEVGIKIGKEVSAMGLSQREANAKVINKCVTAGRNAKPAPRDQVQGSNEPGLIFYKGPGSIG